MKKIFYAFVMMAAAMVGCQNVDENVNINNESNTTGFSVVASIDNELGRPIISENEDGSYTPQWVSDDKANMYLFEWKENGSFENSSSTGMSISEDGRQATFTGFSFPEAESSSYTYVATIPEFHGISYDFVLVRFADVQNAWWMEPEASYDSCNDVLVSQATIRDQQLAEGDQLDIKMARLNSAMKLVVKGLPADNSVISSVTFSCEQPIAGSVKVMLSDLDGVTYPVPTTLVEGVNSITKSHYAQLDTQKDVVAFFSCMPATLAAGEKYTVSVKLEDGRTLVKEGVLRSDITLAAGNVTTVPVNMSDAATVTKVENLSEECEYAIGYTDADGNVHLLPTTARNRRPSGHQVGIAGTGYNEETYDLTKVSINANGSLSGELDATYRWKVAKTASGLYNIYRTFVNGDGETVTTYLIAEGSDTSSLAIKARNDSGVFQAQNGTGYQNTFAITAREGGYDIVYTPEGSSPKYTYVYYTGTQYRVGQGSNGALNFYRIQDGAKVKNDYTVVTKAEDITEGTYVLLTKKEGLYYAMSNDVAIPSPVVYEAKDVAITIDDNGEVTAADVQNKFKWVITQRGESTQWDLRSAVNMHHFLWMRDAGAGVAIGTQDDVKAVNNNFDPAWNFHNVDGKGMQAQTNRAMTAATPRFLYVNGTSWGGAKVATDAIVLVKLSNSTEQIATE